MTPCPHCSIPVSLRINPNVVGVLVDETGAIEAGKLIWSERAWCQLLGRTQEELVACEGDLISYLEQRMLFLRLTVLFGWSVEVGRLCVMSVTIV